MALPALPEISENLGQKTILQTTERLIYSFRDSVPVLKIHGCYLNTQKFQQLSFAFSIPIQPIQGQKSVLM